MTNPRNKIESIGNRITYAWHPDSLTIIIGQSIPKKQLNLLLAWALCWCLVGGAFVNEWLVRTDDEKMFFAISLAFWTFFAFRVGKVIWWRFQGQEMIRITAEGMSLKNAFGTFGKARFFLKENIQRMEVVRRDPTQFMQSLDQSFWIVGGDTLQFTYLRSRFVLGKQLSEKDAHALAKLIDQALRKF